MLLFVLVIIEEEISLFNFKNLNFLADNEIDLVVDKKIPAK